MNVHTRVPGSGLLVSALLAQACAPAWCAESDGPVSVGVAYTADTISNRSGGLRRDTVYLDNLDLTLSFSPESLWGLPDAELFFYGLYNNGKSFSTTIVGDAQVVSNIETGVQAVRVFEAWFRTRVGRQSDLLIGLFDLNSEFDVLQSALLFTHSAHGIGTDIAQSGLTGPSIFPVSGLAVRLSHQVSETTVFRGALFDGVAGDPDDPGSSAITLRTEDGALAIGEFEWSDESRKLLAGAWGYTTTPDRGLSEAEAGAPNSDRDSFGVYLRGETLLPGIRSGPTAFGRIGYAHDNVFDYFASAGLTWQGFGIAGDNDQIGVAVAWAETSGKHRRLAASRGDQVEPREVAIELTYRAAFGEGFALQPALHYVINPGIDPTLGNALVLALRFQVSVQR